MTDDDTAPFKRNPYRVPIGFGLFWLVSSFTGAGCATAAIAIDGTERLVPTFGFLLIMYLPFVAVTGLPVFVLSARAWRRTGIRRPALDIVAGIVAGAVPTTVFFGVALFRSDQSLIFLIWLALNMLAGGLGGFAYWTYAGRHVSRSE